MDLEGYLEVNATNIVPEKAHFLFTETICDNLDKIGIKPPYKIFKEVRLKNFKKSKKEESYEPKNPRLINKDFYRQSDLIIFNSNLYIIEAKVIRTINHKRKEADKIRNIRKQLSAAYAFFKDNFKVSPVLIGAYTRLNSKNFYFFNQNPDGSCPDDSEVLKISGL
ncbi:MAG: hypothetical protein PHH54_03010 [Candidatus Nanoarchaeia archaeon]|nr:hypothetical protein [Candidatus Nanoarchaeia archaeon]MDD5740930.1 hypothetical protein [Candidatus Nanoarchaeia archaeon]